MPTAPVLAVPPVPKPTAGSTEPAGSNDTMKKASQFASLAAGLGTGLIVGAATSYLATRQHLEPIWTATTELAVSSQSQVQLGMAVTIAEQLLKDEETPEKEARRLTARYLEAMLNHAAAYPAGWRLAKPEDFSKARGLIEAIAVKDGTSSPTPAGAPGPQDAGTEDPGVERRRVILPAPQ